jgi:hypothetical protein
VSLACFTKHLRSLEWEQESNLSNKSNKRNTNDPLSQVTKHLIWFWSLERMECFDCVFGVYSLLLYWMRSVRTLDGLNGGGWVVFIASNHLLTIGWLCCRRAHRTVRWCTRHNTIHCPVRATPVDRWVLELLTIEFLCPLATPDSPVTSDFEVLTSDFYTVHCSVDRCAKLTVALLAHRTVWWLIEQSGEL